VARVVLDTNVLDSAMIGHGKPRRLLKHVLARHSTVASREMVAELADVLSRDKFSLTQRQIERFLEIYLRRCEIVRLRRYVHTVEEDPDDDVVLDTAVNGRADVVVTGDRHLLRLKSFEGAQILTVDEALRALGAG